MAMGIVSDQEFESDIINTTNRNKVKPTRVDIIDSNKSGRGNNNVEVPDSLRKIIGETSQIEGRKEALDLASRFGISPSSVSAYNQGAHSTSSISVTPNKNHINQAKERITRKARRKLVLALDSITEDKLTSASVRDLAGVAKNMSAVIKDMEPPPAKESIDKNIQFVIYAPTMKSEETFDAIYVRE